ncbi:MAG TPA: glycoside hydrolase [Clostridiales bacterium]|nr:glycoside hydrolase [Clostridiales bacterium]
MKKIKFMTVILSVAMLFNACSPINNTFSNADNNNINGGTGVSKNTSIGNGKAEKYPISLPDVNKEETSIMVEAENSEVMGNLFISEERAGFSGDGYVSGFNKDYENKLKVMVDVATAQHYDITLCVASNKNVKNSLMVNEKKVGEFEIKDNETDKFIKATFYGLFLEAGTAEISIMEVDGDFDLDYIEVTDNKNLDEISYDISPNLCNENSNQTTKELMEYLTECYGKSIITGQYASSEKNLELEIVHDVTEQYPAIRFGDIGGYSLNGQRDTKETEACIEWNKRGGIVGLMWYWNAPIGRASVYKASSDFNLSKAVTTKDIAMLSLDEIHDLYKNGEISAECYALVKDIDIISEQLKILQDNDTTVLWRPLHEAGGEWFWWGGSGATAYQWLWELLYSRQTYYHELNNLIWVWNGQGKEYTVSNNLFDIASLDIYLTGETDFGSRVEQYQWLNKVTESKKLLAISECGIVPNIDNAFRDKSMWSFFGLWYGNYLMSSDGKFSEAYNSAEQLKKTYNSDGSINLYEYINRNKAVTEK